MFARRLKLILEGPQGAQPVPLPWLQQFFMRDFTGYAAFDETLAAGDGLLEASRAVDRETVRQQFEKWLRGRKMIAPELALRVDE